MSMIKRFIDKVSAMDNRNSKDLVLSANDARVLRDEIAKLLVDSVDNTSPVITEIQITGGKW